MSFSDLFTTKCCDLIAVLDWTKADFKPGVDVINYFDINMYAAIFMILFCPFYWNLVARNEYKTKFLSNFVGNRKVACWLLALTIFIFGLIRDNCFINSIYNQPPLVCFQGNYVLLFGFFCNIFGLILVLTSYYKLGFTGTFLGDYFGFYLEEKVTGFPFNICEHPMYNGSALIFFGYALRYPSIVSLLQVVLVQIVYSIAAMFEGEFTNKIYKVRKDKNL